MALRIFQPDNTLPPGGSAYQGRGGPLRKTLATVALIAITISATLANITSAATINVGNHVLLPNTPGQQVTIPVTGGEMVAGVDLFVQVGDGGPELPNVGLPAGTDAPEISSVDMLTGTIFGGTSATQVDHDRSGVVQVFFSSVALSLPPPDPQEVPAAGTLVTLTVDTTGFNSGTFDLLLSDVMPAVTGGPFDTTLLALGGAAVPATITNGTLVVSAGDADFNSNGGVEGIDLLAWQRGFPTGTTKPEGDADGDGDVDADDLSIWRVQYGMGVSAQSAAISVAIPEPGAVALLLLGILAIIPIASRRK